MDKFWEVVNFNEVFILKWLVNLKKGSGIDWCIYMYMYVIVFVFYYVNLVLFYILSLVYLIKRNDIWNCWCLYII